MNSPPTIAEQARALLKAHPEIEMIELLFPDMNGVARGKWLPAGQVEKLLTGQVRLPMSTYNLDIFSEDVAEAGIAMEVGDPDGFGHPVSIGLAPWAERPTALALMTLMRPDGAPCPFDPRHALAAVVERYRRRGWTPVVAPELEFFLVDRELDASGRAQPPLCPGTGARLDAAQIYQLDVMQGFAGVLAEIRDGALALGAPADGTIAEFGPGQFEANLGHTPDALAAADHAILLKRAIRGVARAHGMEACFMPKPYGDQSGSGQHFHVSLLDENGRNLFADGARDQPNPLMLAAIGGLKASMPEATAVFAPSLNSYRRLRPGSYAPIVAAWGLDNRGAAIRTPETEGPAARIEHRVAGADANPYLALAAILAGMLHGIEQDMDPGAPVAAEAGPGDGPALYTNWPEAVAALDASPFARDALGAEFTRVFTAMKRQEMATLMTRVTDVEFATYLRTL